MQTVDLFMEKGLRDSAVAGNHNFVSLVCDVIESAGLKPNFLSFSETGSSDFSLTHMKPARSAKGLVFRRAYHYPFWQIDREDRRWMWRVAREHFSPEDTDPVVARKFRNFWRKRLFCEASPSDGAHILVPLQGKLMSHRSFQSCSPMDMLEVVRAATDAPVVVALHPKEAYSNKELRALDALGNRFSNITLIKGGADRYLPDCRCVVTQNSSVAFNGFFFNKPAVLFGEIDFHHVAGKATPDTFADVLARELSRKRSWAKYLWWYWQTQSINAGQKNAREMIRARLLSFGWPVDQRESSIQL